MAFVINLVYKTIWMNKVKVIISIICLSFGMLIGAVFISQGNQAVYSYNNYKRYMNFRNIILIETRVESHSNFLADMDLGLIEDLYTYNRVFDNILFYQDKSISNAFVVSTDYNFYTCFKEGYPIKGRWFRSKNEGVIGKDISMKYGISIGDYITVGINVYKISGILDMPYYSNTIIIPQESMNTKTTQNYYIKLSDSSEMSKNQLINELRANERISNILDEQQLFEKEKNRLFKGWTPTIILSAMAFIYGIINIKNIDKFYFHKRKTNYGILLGYGATDFHLFMFMYLESSLLAFISSIITYLSVYLLQYTNLNYIISMRVNSTILILVILLSQLYSFINAYSGVKNMKRLRVADIFKTTI